jgi:CBS domain-containing protein
MQNKDSSSLMPKYAKDIANCPQVINKDSKLSDFASKLSTTKLSRLIIEDKGKHIGIVSTKDWAFYLFKNKNEEGVLDIPLTKIMHHIVYVDEDTPIPKCAAIMLDKRISSLAVGSEEHVDGIFTKTDLVSYYTSHLSLGHRKVDDYITVRYIWASEDENTFNVLEKLVENNISRIIVKNLDGSTKGIVTLGDFMRPFSYLKYPSSENNEENQKEQTMKKLLGPASGLIFDKRIKITEIMSKGLVVIKKNEDLKIACNTFLENHIDGAGVVERDGTLCGILSKTDITRAVASMN